MTIVLKRLAWTAVMILLEQPAASAQQATNLQQQLQQLKQQYEQTTRELEQRIAILEQEIQAQKDVTAKAQQTTAAAAALAARDAVRQALLDQSSQVGSTFQGQLPSRPTYDLLREAETKIEGLRQQVGSFEFHGFVYQRTQDGNPDHGWNRWVSFGARPEVFFTRFLSLAVDGGPITPRAALTHTTSGSARSRSRHKSVLDASSSAARFCGHS
jgi:maltoporin